MVPLLTQNVFILEFVSEVYQKIHKKTEEQQTLSPNTCLNVIKQLPKIICHIIPPKLTIMANYGLINNYDSWTCKEIGFNCERIPRAEVILVVTALSSLINILDHPYLYIITLTSKLNLSCPKLFTIFFHVIQIINNENSITELKCCNYI